MNPKLCFPGAILLVFTLATCHAQAPLGQGIVKIKFDATTVIDFYKAPNDQVYSKRIEFFDDKSIKSWNIRNLKEQSEWLKPQSLWLDYSQFNLRYTSSNNEWIEVIVNNQSGQTYWIRKSNVTEVLGWEDYLKDMFAVSRLDSKGQRIRVSPADGAAEIKYEGADCFKVRALKGDWIEIFTGDHCDAYGSKTKIKSGWIKWRNGEKLLIELFSTS